MNSNKTCRILCLFDIFYTGKIISFPHIMGIMKDYGFQVSKKTIYRDVKLLKRAGIIQVYYSQKEKAYIPVNGDFMYGSCVKFTPDGKFLPPVLPEGKAQRLYDGKNHTVMQDHGRCNARRNTRSFRLVSQ